MNGNLSIGFCSTISSLITALMLNPLDVLKIR
jgi:hypothetical protein